MSNLSSLFQKKGSSTKKALEKAGLSKNAVFFWQRGQYSPNLKNLYKLATANDVTIKQIIEALGHEPLGYPKLKTPISFKGLLKRSGLNQKKLAQVLKTTEATVSKWNTGGNAPTLQYALRMCHIFAVTIDDLAIALFEDCPPSELKKVPLRELLCA